MNINLFVVPFYNPTFGLRRIAVDRGVFNRILAAVLSGQRKRLGFQLPFATQCRIKFDAYPPGMIASSLCAAQVTVDEVPPRRGREPVQQRAVHRLAPRAAVAQGDPVWFCLEGLR